MNTLVTGGAGFIGSEFVRQLLMARESASVSNEHVVCFDALTYAGNITNLASVQHSPGFVFVHGRLQDRELVELVLKKYKIDTVINFAAETHVDRSLHDKNPFFDTNVQGALTVLKTAHACKVKRYVHVSTDEVYGSLATGSATEESAYRPTSPYAESKTEADKQILSVCKDLHGMDIMITRSTNNYGSFQHPEKFIPVMITNVLEGKKVPLYGTGMNIRDWLFVGDNCDAIRLVLEKGMHGEVYNIGGGHEKTNKEVLQTVLPLLNKDASVIEFVEDRKNHDLRYSLDCAKIKKQLGWTPQVSFVEGMKQTVQWYKENASWWQAVKHEQEFQDYDRKHYVELHGMKTKQEK